MTCPLTRDGLRSVSVIVPCFDEAVVVRETHRRLVAALERPPDTDFEIVYVDDGSRDATLDVLRRLQRDDPRVRVLALSRNFGHQIALTAGVRNASGDAVVVMDADLQHPPEVILDMLERWRQGVDVVHGVRAGFHSETAFKRWTSRAFYRFMKRIADVPILPDAGDFRLMDRRVVDALLSMPERDRFVRGMVSWIGFHQEAVSYRQAPRTAGKTKYSLRKMLNFATDALLSFSVSPLRIAVWLGFFASGLAFLGIIYTLAVRLMTDAWVAGWAMQSTVTLFLGGVQLVILGIVGEYLGRIYGEVKRRPLYFVRERLGFKKDDRA